MENTYPSKARFPQGSIKAEASIADNGDGSIGGQSPLEDLSKV
jgi:hypothetical protein